MSSNTTLLYEYVRSLRLYLIPSMVLVALIFVMGSVGNAFALYNYYYYIKRSSHWYLVACLTMYDIFVCAAVMPLEMTYLFMEVINTNEVFCRFYRLVTKSAFVGPLWIVICISAHTYVKICRPFYYVREHNIKIVCYISLVFTLPVHVPIALKTFGVELKNTTTPGLVVYTCGVTAHAQGTLVENVYRGFMILSLVAVLVSLSVFYTLVIRRIRKQSEIIFTSIFGSTARSPAASEVDRKSEALAIDNRTIVDNISQFITLPGPTTLLEPENVLQSDRMPEYQLSTGLIGSSMIQPLCPETSKGKLMPASCISTEEPAVGEKDGSVHDDQKKVSHDPSSLQTSTQNKDTPRTGPKECFSSHISSEVCGEKTEEVEQNAQPPLQPAEGVSGHITSGEETGSVHMHFASEAFKVIKSQIDGILYGKDKSTSPRSNKAHICTSQINLPTSSPPQSKSAVFSESLSACIGDISSQMSHLTLPLWINLSPERSAHDVRPAENTPNQVCNTASVAVDQPAPEDSVGKMSYGLLESVDFLPVISDSAVDNSVITQGSYAVNKDDTKCESSAVTTGTMLSVQTQTTANLLTGFSLEPTSFSPQGRKRSFRRQVDAENCKRRLVFVDNSSLSMFTVCFSFILCYAPSLLLIIFNVEANRHEMGLTVVGVSDFISKFSYVRNAILPVLYFIFNKNFKDLVREQFSKVCIRCSCSR